MKRSRQLRKVKMYNSKTGMQCVCWVFVDGFRILN